MADHQILLRQALDLAVRSAQEGTGPFGAVVAKDGNVIAGGFNVVTSRNDPTAHAEVEAIRNAAAELKNFDLTGCTLYTSSYPCPMCLGAIYWAHIKDVYFANDKKVAADAGFDDDDIFKEFYLSDSEKKDVTIEHLSADHAEEAFTIWNNNQSKITY